MTLQLELGGIQDPDVLRAFEQVSTQFPLRASALASDVLLLAATGTPRRVAFDDSSVITWNGTTLSDTLVVTHGLGATPKAVEFNLIDIGQMVHIFTTAKSSTTFTVQARAAAAVGASTSAFDWVAFG